MWRLALKFLPNLRPYTRYNVTTFVRGDARVANRYAGQTYSLHGASPHMIDRISAYTGDRRVIVAIIQGG